MGEGDLLADVSVVLVTLHDLGLVSCEVRANKAEAGGVEEEPDGHAPFVPRLPGHPGLDAGHGHISMTTTNKQTAINSHNTDQLKAELSGINYPLPVKHFMVNGRKWQRYMSSGNGNLWYYSKYVHLTLWKFLLKPFT